MPKQIRRKIINKNYLSFKKKSYKSIKIKKYSLKSHKSKKTIKINYPIIICNLFTFLVLFYIVTLIYKNRKKNKPLIFPENQEYFNNLLHIINTEKKYISVKNCYYNNDDTCIYKYLCPKKVVGKNLKLFGLKKDGGYVLTDDLKNIKIAYSFGVDGEFSFDMHLADNDIDVYMYDPFIKGLDFSKYNLNNGLDFKNNINYYRQKLHFFKTGITGSIKQNNMKTLQEILNDNGHSNEKDMILKMDIEYAEWDALNEITEDILKKFKYIVIEFHLWKRPEKLIINVLKKLLKFHQVIFIRFNNAGQLIEFGRNKICNAIEVTYMLKEGNEFVMDSSIYPPKEINFNNFKDRPSIDFDLNIFKLFYK